MRLGHRKDGRRAKERVNRVGVPNDGSSRLAARRQADVRPVDDREEKETQTGTEKPDGIGTPLIICRKRQCTYGQRP